MVRQLPPSEKELLIEIYVFATTIKWVEYEGIQSDIFDHVLAVIPEFDPKIYQYPTDKFFGDRLKKEDRHAELDSASHLY